MVSWPGAFRVEPRRILIPRELKCRVEYIAIWHC